MSFVKTVSKIAEKIDMFMTIKGLASDIFSFAMDVKANPSRVKRLARRVKNLVESLESNNIIIL